MAVQWASVRYFTAAEFICRGITCCGGTERMDEDFVLRLDDLRKALGKPLIVTSGYRCPEHNAAVSKTGRNGPHVSGKACDIAVFGRDTYTIIRLALERDITGIGVFQKGPHGRRFLHLDTLSDAPGRPRPWVWSY